jgi:chromosome partitioning protein
MNKDSELIGLSEVSELFGVSKQVVANWRLRRKDFPKPLAELKSGPIWQYQAIKSWAEQNNVDIRAGKFANTTEGKEEGRTRMATTVALVNMKGGVGKSTLTANLGWYCAYKKDKRILLIDLDPQFNLSQYILGSEKYEDHIKSDHGTVLDIFEQFTPSVISKKKKSRLSAPEVIINVKDWDENGRIDLIPSRLELAWTLKNPEDKKQLLNDFLDEIRNEYDLILIDCPPTESMLTTAAYLASDSVLVPVRPEFLSTIGLPLLVRSLEEFKQKHKQKIIDLMGIVFNASGDKLEHDRSRKFVSDVARKENWYVFKKEVAYSDSYAVGSRAGKPIFLTAYARGWKIDAFIEVAEEFCNRVGF